MNEQQELITIDDLLRNAGKYIDDEDKIVLTQAQILPRFLQHAAEQVQKKSEILVC